MLGAYFCLNMVLITLSSFLSVTVINIYMREDQTNKVPGWLRKVSLTSKARYTHCRQSWIQHGRLCWKSTVAETGNKSATKSTVADTFNFVTDTVGFVASVYGAKATRST